MAEGMMRRLQEAQQAGGDPMNFGGGGQGGQFGGGGIAEALLRAMAQGQVGQAQAANRWGPAGGRAETLDMNQLFNQQQATMSPFNASGPQRLGNQVANQTNSAWDGYQNALLATAPLRSRERIASSVLPQLLGALSGGGGQGGIQGFRTDFGSLIGRGR